MGNRKQKWTSEEEDALRAGIDKHGVGKWKNIQRDPEFGQCLAARSNIDLKDKWRNLSVSACSQGSREKVKTPKLKTIPTVSVSNLQNSPPTPVAKEASVNKATDSAKTLLDQKSGPRYNSLIFEALTTLKDPNGSEVGAVVNFIKQRHEVPQNFRRLLSSKLRRLVAQDKLEKVHNFYKIKRDNPSGTGIPTSKQKDPRSKQSQNPGFNTAYDKITIEEASIAAAYKIAEAENKSFVASEALKEAERVSKMAEESDSLLQLAQEILDQCSRGEIVMMAEAWD